MFLIINKGYITTGLGICAKQRESPRTFQRAYLWWN